MDAKVLVDALLASNLVPSIMGINAFKMFKKESSFDLVYVTITFGTILGAIYSLLQTRLNRSVTKSRSKLTILTALLMTTSALVSIVGFSIIRINIPSSRKYTLPAKLRIPSNNDTPGYIFEYHFFADIIPGFIILLQAYLCSMIQHDLVHKAKRLFTIGEAAIISQLTSAAFLLWSLVTYSRLTNAGPFAVHLTTEIVLNIGIILFSTVFLPSYLFLKQINHRKAKLIRYTLLLVCLALSYIRIQYLLYSSSSQANPIRWFAVYIFSTHQRISLFSIWLSTLVGCLSFSASWAQMVGTSNSLVRKIFHLAIGVVFVTGYNQDINFTKFASSGILILMLLLEMIRAWQLEPIGSRLERVCQSLRGKWDNRYLTLSHMYLLIGVFIPLWLSPSDSRLTNKLYLSSGFIAVGVGDTAAAVIGTFLGKTKFKGKSEKSLEGLVANLLAMVVCKLMWVGYDGFVTEFSFAMAAILTSLIEAITCHCDNLILPLVMMFFLDIF